MENRIGLPILDSEASFLIPRSAETWVFAPMKPMKDIHMLNKFDSDQLWVALIISLVMICLAAYRIWRL